MYDSPSAITAIRSNGFTAEAADCALLSSRDEACESHVALCAEPVQPFERLLIGWSLGGGAVALLLLGLGQRLFA